MKVGTIELIKKRHISRRNGFSFVNMLYFAGLLAYLEILFHIVIYKKAGIGLFYGFVFAVSAGLLLGLLTNFTKARYNRRLAYSLTAAVCLLFCVQFVYYRVFGTFLALNSVGTGGIRQGWEFRDVVFSTIRRNLMPLILFLLPVPVIIYLGPTIDFRRKPWKVNLLLTGVLVGVYVVSLFSLLAGGRNSYSPYDLYYNTVSPDLSMEKLGLITTMRLDAKRLMFGTPESGLVMLDNETETDRETEQQSQAGEDSTELADVPQGAETDTSPNVMDIDFAGLIAQADNDNVKSMHKYFSQVSPTNKNKYTGMFEGYNLIFLVAEGFSPLAVDEQRTPTLYKMMHEGFDFTHFYNPIWGVSTTDGEYVNMTGLIPKSGEWTFETTGRRQNDMYFTMGRQFERMGYTTRAYHNHTYDYYYRNLSHPNMGYTYIAGGNGYELELHETTGNPIWPQSDLKMMEQTVDDYIQDEHFHTYYMTVSGHLEYTFSGNMQAWRNREVSENLPLSEMAQAYLACNYELEEAMTYLVDRLNQAGIANKTLIVLSADHYPYGLIKNDDYSAFNELLGHEVEKNFELYQNALIIWSASMKEPVVVDKYCSTLDLIPTISNLLGLEYDSRLLMGTDILSDSEPLVIFNNRSWISQDCMYNSKNGEVTPITDKEITSEYIEKVNKIVSNKTQLSAWIVDYDYYQYIDPQRQQ